MSCERRNYEERNAPLGDLPAGVDEENDYGCVQRDGSDQNWAHNLERLPKRRDSAKSSSRGPDEGVDDCLSECSRSDCRKEVREARIVDRYGRRCDTRTTRG